MMDRAIWVWRLKRKFCATMTRRFIFLAVSTILRASLAFVAKDALKIVETAKKMKRLVNLESIFGICGHRLFQKHVFAGFEGFDSNRCVQMVGHGDDDSVDVGLIEQLTKIGIGA